MKILFVICSALGCLTLSSKTRAQEYYLLIGTYTSSGSSRGIYVYKFDSHTAESTPVSSAASGNPSFLAVSPDERFVYSVNEDAPGKLSAYAFDKKTGELKFLNEQPSHGNHPCYITTDKKGKWVIAGNYSSGTVAVYPVLNDGLLGESVTMIKHEGYSVNTERQEGPHVHATVLSPDNKYLFVPDLGTDKVMIYAFNEKNGKLQPAKMPYVETEPGAGPRHFEFHPTGKYAYLLEELTGTISVYRYSKGQLMLIQNTSAQPLDYLGPSGSADIHVSKYGKYVYASNRAESNTIGIFKVDAKTGMLVLADHASTLGKTPRNFNFDPGGNFLLVANQNSDQVVIFSVDKATGFLSDTGKRIDVAKPVCLKWISVK